MRILLVALAIAWLSATGAAFEAGRRAEAEYRAAVEALTRDAVPVSLARYERGVFGSEAVIVLGPATLAEGEVSATRLVLRQRIDHGPYPFSWIASEAFDGRPIVARVEAVPTLEIEGPEVIEEVPLPVVVRALFTRGDRASIRLIPDPEADALDDPELSADWRAMHAEVGFAYDGSAISGDLAVPRVAWEREDASFRLEGLALALDLARAAGPAPAFVGRTRLRVGLLSVAGPDGGFTLRDLEMENGSEIGPGGWSLRVDGSLGAVEERAPGLAAVSRRVGGGELGLRLAHVDLEPLAELESVASVAEGEGPASDEAKAELLGAVVALWPRLMAPGPELELSRLRVETPTGELRMAFRIAVDPSEPVLLAHPLSTLPALELDLELSLPRPMLEGWLASPRPVVDAGGGVAPWVMPAEQASRRVETWLEHGHLDERDGSYVASVRMRRGVLRLNGRVVGLDAL